MQTNIAATTTYFVGNHYIIPEGGELTNGLVTKYYYAGSQRIAMRKNGTLNYMIGDHLGSTSLVTDAAGNVINQTQYKAWGEERYVNGAKSTGYGYTGQYSYASDFGLQFYNARWYDSSLGRFIQADTIVPGGVQGYDRYAYVNNSPARYSDPSGHSVDCGVGDYGCNAGAYTSPLDQKGSLDRVIAGYGITTIGLERKQKWDVLRAANRAGIKLTTIQNSVSIYTKPEEVFKLFHGSITIQADASRNNCETIGSGISCGSGALNQIAFLHEFGHVFDNHAGGRASDMLASPLDTEKGYWSRTTKGFICAADTCLAHNPSMGYYSVDANGNEVKTTDQSSAQARDEQWADLYMNFMLHDSNDPNHGFRHDSAGNIRIHEVPNIVLGIY